MVLAATTSALMTAPAGAQLIVGNDQAGVASIYNIDVSTGLATAIYTGSGTDAKPWGMAYDAGSNTLYWNNGAALFSSPLGPTLTPTNLGTMTFNSATVNFVGLSFANGRLYGTRNIATEAVYEINVGTRTATPLYVHPSTFDFGGIDHDAATGKLYGLSDSGGAGLYEIDPVAQTTTLRTPYPVGETDIDGLAVHNGLAYYVTDGPNTTQANFYVFNIASGQQVATLPSPFTGSGTFSAATFASAIPEPSLWVLWLAGLAGLAAWTRRRHAASS
jgi:MYXO-CTERM domain-containing protein